MYVVIKYLDILYVHVVEFYTRYFLIEVFLLILGNANIKQAYYTGPFIRKSMNIHQENIKGYFQLDKI